MSMELLNQYRNWSAISADQRPSFIEYLKITDPWLLAHHPRSRCFREHVWEFNGFYLCKGCVVTSAGFLAGVILQVATGWVSSLSDQAAGAVFLMMLLPTIGTSLLDAPRVYKHVSRFLLGVLLASAVFLLFITESWAVRVVVIVTYIVARRSLESAREKKNRALLAACD